MTKPVDGTSDPQQLSFEDALAELEAIVRRLEEGSGKLDDAIAAYERGAMLKRHCEAKLQEAQMRIEKIVLGPDGAPVLRLPQIGDTLAVPRNGAPSTLIVKPDNPHLPGITENEVWCLRMAQAIGIDAAQATILRASKRTAIAVLRYDRRVGRGGQINRLHQEDFAQANGLLRVSLIPGQ